MTARLAHRNRAGDPARHAGPPGSCPALASSASCQPVSHSLTASHLAVLWLREGRLGPGTASLAHLASTAVALPGTPALSSLSSRPDAPGARRRPGA